MDREYELQDQFESLNIQKYQFDNSLGRFLRSKTRNSYNSK